jgi:hypothetical protein
MQRQKRHVLSVAMLKRLFMLLPGHLPAAANCNDPLRNDPLRNGKPA